MSGRKKADGHDIAGRIITVLFIAILIGGVYFLISLFKSIDITPLNMEGEWKLPGAPVTYYTFSMDANIDNGGYASSFEKVNGTGKVVNQTQYSYKLEVNDNGVMQLLLQPLNERGKKNGDVIVIKVTSLSRAQMAVIVNGSEMKSMTRTDMF